jgi:hypothetical protein
MNSDYYLEAYTDCWYHNKCPLDDFKIQQSKSNNILLYILFTYIFCPILHSPFNYYLLLNLLLVNK